MPKLHLNKMNALSIMPTGGRALTCHLTTLQAYYASRRPTPYDGETLAKRCQHIRPRVSKWFALANTWLMEFAGIRSFAAFGCKAFFVSISRHLLEGNCNLA